MQRLELWLRAKAIIRIPRFEQPTKQTVLPPIQQDRKPSKPVIYSPEMKDNYLHIPNY